MNAGSAEGFELVAQAAQRLLDLLQPTPWPITPPLPPAFTALLSRLTGLSTEASLLVVVFTVWFLGAAAVFAVVRSRLGTPAAWQAGLVTLTLPSRFLALWWTEEPHAILFWGSVPLLVLALQLRPVSARIPVAAVAFAGAVGCRSWHWSRLDGLALVEMVLLAVWLLSNREREGTVAKHTVRASSNRSLMVAARYGCVAATICVGVALFAMRPEQPFLATQGRTLESIQLETTLDARRRAGAALIASPDHPDETLLWLRALAVSSLAGPCEGKIAALLERMPSTDDRCRFELTQNTARAVVVSRSGYDDLRPVRGPLDVERLQRYVTWAARPETITVHHNAPGRLEIRADLGPNAAILLRHDFRGPWRVEPPGVELLEDPLGYLVLAPPHTDGWIDITLESAVSPLSFLWPSARDDHPVEEGGFPIIHAEGVVDGVSFQGPPYSPGSVVSIFGSRFSAAGNDVFVAGSPAEIVFESDSQINARLPSDLPAGLQNLTVVSHDRSTEPYAIEVSP